MSFCVRSIRIFSKFLGDPYYEPLSWFMIEFINKMSNKAFRSNMTLISNHTYIHYLEHVKWQLLPVNNVKH